MKKNKDKKITIDKLALMIGKGFVGVDKKLESMDKKLDRIENVLIKQHSEEIDNLKKRMYRLEEALAINK